VVESCTISSSRSRRPVRKLLDAPSYIPRQKRLMFELTAFILELEVKMEAAESSETVVNTFNIKRCKAMKDQHRDINLHLNCTTWFGTLEVRFLNIFRIKFNILIINILYDIINEM